MALTDRSEPSTKVFYSSFRFASSERKMRGGASAVSGRAAERREVRRTDGWTDGRDGWTNVHTTPHHIVPHRTNVKGRQGQGRDGAD